MKSLILFTIKVYQRLISPLLPKNCRYYPSCSNYTIKVVENFGVIKGCFLGLLRIASCHPLFCGGIDFPPEHWPGWKRSISIRWSMRIGNGR